MEAKFIASFTDNATFVGDLFKKQWSDIPIKEIKSLYIEFAGRNVKMEDYLEYDLTFEQQKITNKATRIAYVTLVGRRKEVSDVIVFDLIKGKIRKFEGQHGKEYGNLISSTWKRGIKD